MNAWNVFYSHLLEATQVQFHFWDALQWLARFIIQVGLLASLIYLALLFLRGTRGAPVLVGLVIVTLVGWVLSQLLGLEVFEYLLSRAPAFIAFAVLIIFQPELRRAFAEIGSNPQRLLGGSTDIATTIEALVEACYDLAAKRTGALLAIERSIGMRAFAETGVRIQAPVSSELLSTIFFKNTPLHDGAVIVKDGIIVAANCYFPLTQAALSRELGTRHRAAVGVTEETDAVAIVVSEETGAVSLAYGGRLVRDIDRVRLRRHLTNYLLKRPGGAGGAAGWRGWLEHVRSPFARHPADPPPPPTETKEQP